MGGGLDAEVPKHGVRFPASKELDDVGVNASDEQGSSPARAQRERAERRFEVRPVVASMLRAA